MTLGGYLTRETAPLDDPPMAVVAVLRHVLRVCRLEDVDPVGTLDVGPLVSVSDDEKDGVRWELRLDQ